MKFNTTTPEINSKNLAKIPFIVRGEVESPCKVTVKAGCGCTSVKVKVPNTSFTKKLVPYIEEENVEKEFIVTGFLKKRDKVGKHTKKITVKTDNEEEDVVITLTFHLTK